MSAVPEPASAGQSKTNVLFIHGVTLPPLGADTWIQLQIIGGLDRARHSVHVAHSSERDGETTPIAGALADIEAVQLFDISLGDEGLGESSRAWRTREGVRGLGGLARLLLYIRRNKISVVHTTDRPRDALATVLLGRLTGATSIVHLHVLYRDWMGRALQWAIRNADVRVAVSQFVADSITEAGIEGPTHVVSNAIVAADWTPGVGGAEVRSEFGIGEDAPLIVTACRLFPEKGVEPLIRATAKLVSDFPDLKLLIVGAEPAPNTSYTAHLAAVVDELGIGSSVVFAGRRPDVDACMAAADIFAMPSFEEPFGLVFTEAMAMERPIVALDNGGAKEIIVHGETGLLSEPDDADGLEQNLRALLADSGLRDRLGAAGRRRVIERFDVARMADDAADVYLTVRDRAVK